MDSKKEIFFLFSVLVIFMYMTPTTAINIDCSGKPFHCINSTHFMICVDLGSGVSKTVDNTLIQCPPTTGCHKSNYFECEYQLPTTTVSIIRAGDETNEMEVNTQVTKVSLFPEPNFNTLSDTTQAEFLASIQAEESSKIFKRIGKNKTSIISELHLFNLSLVTNSTEGKRDKSLGLLKLPKEEELLQESTTSPTQSYNPTQSIQIVSKQYLATTNISQNEEINNIEIINTNNFNFTQILLLDSTTQSISNTLSAHDDSVNTSRKGEINIEAINTNNSDFTETLLLDSTTQSISKTLSLHDDSANISRNGEIKIEVINTNNSDFTETLLLDSTTQSTSKFLSVHDDPANISRNGEIKIEVMNTNNSEFTETLLLDSTTKSISKTLSVHDVSSNILRNEEINNVGVIDKNTSDFNYTPLIDSTTQSISKILSGHPISSDILRNEEVNNIEVINKNNFNFTDILQTTQSISKTPYKQAISFDNITNKSTISTPSDITLMDSSFKFTTEDTKNIPEDVGTSTQFLSQDHGVTTNKKITDGVYKITTTSYDSGIEALIGISEKNVTETDKEFTRNEPSLSTNNVPGSDVVNTTPAILTSSYLITTTEGGITIDTTFDSSNTAAKTTIDENKNAISTNRSLQYLSVSKAASKSIDEKTTTKYSSRTEVNSIAASVLYMTEANTQDSETERSTENKKELNPFTSLDVTENKFYSPDILTLKPDLNINMFLEMPKAFSNFSLKLPEEKINLSESTTSPSFTQATQVVLKLILHKKLLNNSATDISHNEVIINRELLNENNTFMLDTTTETIGKTSSELVVSSDVVSSTHEKFNLSYLLTTTESLITIPLNITNTTKTKSNEHIVSTHLMSHDSSNNKTITIGISEKPTTNYISATSKLYIQEANVQETKTERVISTDNNTEINTSIYFDKNTQKNSSQQDFVTLKPDPLTNTLLPISESATKANKIETNFTNEARSLTNLNSKDKHDFASDFVTVSELSTTIESTRYEPEKIEVRNTSQKTDISDTPADKIVSLARTPQPSSTIEIDYLDNVSATPAAVLPTIGTTTKYFDSNTFIASPIETTPSGTIMKNSELLTLDFTTISITPEKSHQTVEEIFYYLRTKPITERPDHENKAFYVEKETQTVSETSVNIFTTQPYISTNITGKDKPSDTNIPGVSIQFEQQIVTENLTVVKSTKKPPTITPYGNSFISKRHSYETNYYDHTLIEKNIKLKSRPSLQSLNSVLTELSTNTTPTLGDIIKLNSQYPSEGQNITRIITPRELKAVSNTNNHFHNQSSNHSKSGVFGNKNQHQAQPLSDTSNTFDNSTISTLHKDRKLSNIFNITKPQLSVISELRSINATKIKLFENIETHKIVISNQFFNISPELQNTTKSHLEYKQLSRTSTSETAEKDKPLEIQNLNLHEITIKNKTLINIDRQPRNINISISGQNKNNTTYEKPSKIQELDRAAVVSNYSILLLNNFADNKITLSNDMDKIKDAVKVHNNNNISIARQELGLKHGYNLLNNITFNKMPYISNITYQESELTSRQSNDSQNKNEHLTNHNDKPFATSTTSTIPNDSERNKAIFKTTALPHVKTISMSDLHRSENVKIGVGRSNNNTFTCKNRLRGRYADNNNCRRFYVCIGKIQHVVGKCPVNTVFSEIKKQCTKNLSHCMINNQFHCIQEGRFSDILNSNTYFICVKHKDSYLRFKFQCQGGFYLNKTSITCVQYKMSQSSISIDSESNKASDQSTLEFKPKEKKNIDVDTEKNVCKHEGKFADPDDCRRYYVCSKNSKSVFRRRNKKCDSDEVFHREKKKCVNDDSYECK